MSPFKLKPEPAVMAWLALALGLLGVGAWFNLPWAKFLGALMLLPLLLMATLVGALLLLSRMTGWPFHRRQPGDPL